MRRTAGMVLGVGLAVALAGVATAAVREPGTTGPDGASRPAPPSAAAEGRLEVGAVLSVRETLDYLTPLRSRTLTYPGASYVKVHLTPAVLLPGDYVTVADPTGEEVHRYDASQLTQERWAMSVTGDTAVVTLHTGVVPLGVRRALPAPGAGVDRVAYGHTRAELAGAPVRESLCGSDDKADAVCYREKEPMLYKRSKAVARLLINGTELCTAWRVGSKNRLLTNHHCFTESKDAHNTEVWFNYQCATCGGYAVFKSTKVWADEVLATDETLDFTLFTVENFDEVTKFGYLELDSRRPVAGDKVYIPQHPRGEPTAIATSSDHDASGNCAVDSPDYRGYADASDVSYFCDTEGGSSGSPVLSRTTHKVIALHHFGGCPNSGVRIDLIQRKVGALL